MKTDSALDDWAIVRRLLPDGWEAQAKPLGALRRARGIPDAATLMRVLLVHLADGCSLAETAARASEHNWCHLSTVAVLKRLRTSEAWVNWICQRLWSQRGRRMSAVGRRVRAFDATLVVEGGRTGSQWRIHYGINLSDLRCDFFRVTSLKVGESFAQMPVIKGDLVLGDRGLCSQRGIADMVRRGGDVLVRVNTQNLPLVDERGKPWKPTPRLRRLKIGRCTEWHAGIRSPSGELIPGRLIAIRRSARAAETARRHVRRKAQRDGRPAGEAALEAAAFMVLWTTMPSEELTPAQALDLYRVRWQVELAFKRAKSILSLGQLPKRSDDAARAWLQGKLLVALLIERLIREAEAFSPWGYPLEEEAKPLPRNTLDGPRVERRGIAASGH